MKKINTLLALILFSFIAFAQSGEQIFTASGAFTVPPGVTSVTIEVIGAGGNGGYNGTGGGGGGGYASGNYTVTPLEVLNVTIGYPGSGALAGTTSVADLIFASGGENGVSVPNPEIGGGGAAGIGSGGNISNYSGGIGGGGYYTYFGGGGGGAAGPSGDGGIGGNTIAWTGICLTPGGDAGISGGIPGGDGGKGAGFTDAFCITTDPAGTGVNYGGGGGGGNGNGGVPGNGAGGYSKISWCAVDNSTTTVDETITATATGTSYQWIDCGNGNVIIDGATEQSYTATVTGSYAVIVTDAICSDTSACVDIEIIVIGINSFLSDNLIVSPNPFSSFINIENNIGNYNYTIINSLGQLLWSGNNIEQQNFSYLENGLYFLKVEGENGNQIISLIK